MQFSKVIGHAALKAKLIGNIREGRIPHAQLFVGPRGSGNLPMALAYAQYLLCEDRQAVDACGECPSCLQMAKLEHPDLHLAFPIYFTDKVKVCEAFVTDWRKAVRNEPYLDMDRWREGMESENKQLRMGVDIAHEIQRRLSLKSFRGGHKVMLVWMPELMDAAASNKLLKVLEEPEPNTLFLLVATDMDQLLATIVSRAQLVKVPALATDEVADALRERMPELGIDAARAAAARSEGDLLEAVRLASESEAEHFVFFRDWLRACYKREVTTTAELADGFAKLGREWQKSLVRYGLFIMRQCALRWMGADGLVRVDGQELEFVGNFSKLLSERSADGIRRELEIAHTHIERNANPKVMFMDMSYRMMGLLRVDRQ
ncbi:MAG: hypothetical protein IPJ85_13795 [Flavobacteriales bacterium]|nr:hypothetical protein [Flavobacteriales bacterium]